MLHGNNMKHQPHVDLTLYVCCYIKDGCRCANSCTQAATGHVMISISTSASTSMNMSMSTCISIGMCSLAAQKGYLCCKKSATPW